MGRETITEKRDWLHYQLDGAIIFAVLTTFFVSLRCVGLGILSLKKKNLIRLSFWEDALILMSLISFLPLCACAIVDAHAYLALYSPLKTTQDEVTIFKASYGMSVAYPIACVLPKLSICCMYLTLLRPNHYLRRATYMMIAFLVANAVAWFVPTVAVCRPISAYWNQEPAKCIDYQVFGVWISLPHVVSDLVILILPLPVLWKMRISRTSKFSLTVTFLTGSIGIVGACIRLALYIHRLYVQKPGSNQSTRSIAGEVIVSYVEPGMYLIAACLPRLRPLIICLHATLRVSFSSLLGRRYGSDDSLPSPTSGRQAPHIDMKLTGQGNLTSLTHEEKKDVS
ncbi:MAG: hypothetical protein Q9195_008155 [Heterodermia aff. obscurata]